MAARCAFKSRARSSPLRNVADLPLATVAALRDRDDVADDAAEHRGADRRRGRDDRQHAIAAGAGQRDAGADRGEKERAPFAAVGILDLDDGADLDPRRGGNRSRLPRRECVDLGDRLLRPALLRAAERAELVCRSRIFALLVRRRSVARFRGGRIARCECTARGGLELGHQLGDQVLLVHPEILASARPAGQFLPICVPAADRGLSLAARAATRYDCAMSIAALDEADVAEAAELLVRAGLPGGAANIGRYRRWQPDGAWKVVRDGRLVGMVTLLRFGHVGFVGCMAVEPALQGAGIGRELLEHAHDHGSRNGVTTFALEATPVGERLYRKLGYVGEGETALVARTAAGESSRERIADRTGIIELDALATATPRAVMIEALLDEAPGATTRIGGELVGYGLALTDRLGPVIARDVGAGRALVDQLAPGCAVAAVPVANEPALAAFAANGFREARRLRRMRRGPAVAIETPWIWALASPGAG